MELINVYRQAYSGLSREVWLFSLAMFINRSGSMVLGFLALYLAEVLKLSIGSVGLVFSIYGMGSICGAYLGGRLTRRFGPIRIQILGLILSGPCYMAIPWFDDFYSVALMIFLMSLFSESVRPANSVAVARFSNPQNQTRSFGLQRMAVNLGFSIGPAVGGFLAMIDFSLLFIVDGAFSIAGGLFLAAAFRKEIASEQGTINFQLGSPSQADENLPLNSFPSVPAKVPVLDPCDARTVRLSNSPWRDPFFLTFLILLLLVMIVFFQFTITYPRFLTDHYGLSKPQLGILYGINTLMVVAFEMLLLNAVARFAILKVIGWGALLTCFGFGILPWGSSFAFAVLAMGILTVGEMLLMPLATTFSAQRGNGRDQAMYMSYYAMLYSLAAIMGPLIGSAMYEIDPARIWYYAIGIGLTVFVGMRCLRQRIGN